MARRTVKSNLPPPFLKRLTFIEERIQPDEFPFTIPAFQRGRLQLDFERPITIIVGENGTGKSTLLEGIAGLCGFNLSGGNRNHVFNRDLNQATIGHALRGSWLPKVGRGFFLRAESFFNFGHYIDQVGHDTLAPYGGKSLHEQSHGESFLALFNNKFRGQAIYILDEPEAALSPKRRLQFLKLMRLLELEGDSQFIIATHSPILMAYPRAQLLMFDGRVIREVSAERDAALPDDARIRHEPEGHDGRAVRRSGRRARGGVSVTRSPSAARRSPAGGRGRTARCCAPRGSCRSSCRAR